MSILATLINKELKKTFGIRYDGSPAFPYWRAKDLGIEDERFSFVSDGYLIRGSKYYLKNQEPKALIVFFHGLGDGRASYVKEISLLVKQGYLVYAYDNTGCMESEGTSVIGMDHALVNQKDFFEYLESDIRAKNLKRFVIGHSWGGFVAMHACKKEYKVLKCVSLAGFIDTSSLLKLRLPKQTKPYEKALIKALKMSTPKYGNLSALETVKNSDSKVYFIYGEKDQIVPRSIAADPFIKEFKNDSRIKIEEVKNIGHSVYRDHYAEAYVGELLKRGLGTTEADENLSMDLERATVQNLNLWSKIFSFLSN